MELIIKLGLSYLIGSTSGSVLLGKLKGVDIRNLGSGNAGGTNAFRTQGVTFATGVLFVDIMKGFISAKFISAMNLPIFSGTLDPNLLIILCGIAAILGHVYPIYHGFRGGKGGGAAVGMVFAISWPTISLAILLWLVILLLTGFVGLGTIISYHLLFY